MIPYSLTNIHKIFGRLSISKQNKNNWKKKLGKKSFLIVKLVIKKYLKRKKCLLSLFKSSAKKDLIINVRLLE